MQRWRRQVHTRGKSMIGTQIWWISCRTSLSSQSARPPPVAAQPQKQETETAVPFAKPSQAKPSPALTHHVLYTLLGSVVAVCCHSSSPPRYELNTGPDEGPAHAPPPFEGGGGRGISEISFLPLAVPPSFEPTFGRVGQPEGFISTQHGGPHGHQPLRGGGRRHRRRAHDRRARAAGRLPRAQGDALQAGRQGLRGEAGEGHGRRHRRPGRAGRREHDDGPSGRAARPAEAAARLCRQRPAGHGHLCRPDFPRERRDRAKGGRPGAGRRPGRGGAAQLFRLAGGRDHHHHTATTAAAADTTQHRRHHQSGSKLTFATRCQRACTRARLSCARGRSTRSRPS